MPEALWFVFVGCVLVFMGLAASTLSRLPCSAAMFYLLIGFGLGTPVAGVLQLNLAHDAHLLRTITEVALLVSLFAIGLRLRVGLLDTLWTLPFRLGVIAMLITVPLLALACVYVLDLQWGPALLLAAILSPTDPVLAHDVQVHNPGDLDVLRFGLSGEGGINDGIALPFALLGLVLCSEAAPGPQHQASLMTLILPALWGIVGGVGIGALLGWVTTHTVAWLRTRYARALGLEGFFALGLIALSFGCAQYAHAYGFLAVFSAGVVMRRAEMRASNERPADEVLGTVDTTDIAATASDPDKAHAYMAQSVMGFTIELERVAEAAVMTIAGNMLAELGTQVLSWHVAALCALLFLLVRPVAVAISLAGSRATRTQRRLMAWFGIRGIGSIYYLAYAFEAGRSEDVTPLAPLALGVVAASVIVHGVSATPLMNWYHGLRGERGGPP